MVFSLNGAPTVLNYPWPTQLSSADPKNCGSYGIRMHSSAIPSLTINPNGETDFDVILQTTNASQIGVHTNQNVEVYLVDFPSASSQILDIFQATILADCSTT